MAKNTHLEHLEDDILNQGKQGGFNAITFLRELGEMLSVSKSNVRVTTKWDGAPAIICGTDPVSKQFFVGTKSVFAKTAPKIIYSEADASRIYGDSQLAQKLKDSYKYLSKLKDRIPGVLQGDLLFTDDKDTRLVNNEQCVTFQPNTIVYAIPVSSDMGKRSLRAKLGIVFHTTYVGPTLDDLNAQFGADVSQLQGDPEVMVFSSDFRDVTGTASMTPIELQQFNLLVNRAEGSLKQASAFLDLLGDYGQSKFQMNKLFKQFFNSYIRQGKKITNAQLVVNDFNKYYSDLLTKEVQSKKTVATQDKYLKIKTEGLDFLKRNQKSVYFTVASYMNLIEAKNYVIRKLERVQEIGTFLRTDNGYKVTAPEGFVAIRSGNALKLVDRLEFSRANFTADKNWDKP
ncbi:hypothetical protein S820908_150 [Synechococcus phage S-CAM9]|uniref:Uncharacterized protein n=2 Tax=Synechococcus phage S-CAM9 TaxID=1883369 RepID=A0A1D8KQ94_9CAUD|nr:hypothetical protein BOW85_gp098 [Synechococcus phage S-CAM9]AOV60525.1 hypothetical protein S820908_150 [Synechococcus phage S-CAM9]AOV60754.1 hypothetical protein N161109_151 [Synechococcus phage S-CAM9]